MITDSFHADRWDYVFRRQKANSRELEQRKLAVFFEDGKLKHIDGDVTPAGVDAGGLKTPAARPAPAAAADKPAAVPVPSGDNQPQEKGWWERLKDKIKF